MVDRFPVSGEQNIFYDSENIDDNDLSTEQEFNNLIQSGIINNHFGTGVLPDALGQRILFDSSLATGLLDGVATDSQLQPSDSNYGTQLEVELTGSKVAGKRTVKVLIIGLDFDNNLQYDRFIFHTNEKQTSSKHFKILLKILLNDFSGISTQSLNLGGKLVIRETKPFSLSRDCVMISQDIEPNLFFRDFFVSTGGTLSNVLNLALPSYNIDNLNITTGYKQLRSLVENDISSQIGQKFLASSNNIQKISLLMSVTNPTTPSNLVWTGDLIISIYQLQSTIDCRTDIIPSLAIDFDPSSIPLAQLSVDYNSFLTSGVKLDESPQPVDFIFSNTPVGSGALIVPGNYYTVTVKRAGSADTAQIQLAVGNHHTKDSRLTLFNGTTWVDVPEEDLWFQIYTDSAKVSDGQAYDAGHGIKIPKVKLNLSSGATEDYSLNNLQFIRNDLYFAHVAADTEESNPVQDERTGNPILSRKQFVPVVKLVNATDLLPLQSVSSPLLVGTIADNNVKSYNGATATISSYLHEFGMVGNEVVIKIIDDSSDGYRYDLSVIQLISDLVNGNFKNAKFIPNTADTSLFYRISKAELITMLYGDINGDGIVDNNDLIAAQNLIGDDLNSFPSLANYTSFTALFVNESSLSWQIVDPSGPTVIETGSDGIVTVNLQDGSLANFNSVSANFSSVVNIGNYKLVITGASNPGNNGTFKISGVVDNANISIRKIYYDADTLLKVLRADITGDMIISTADTNSISNYINLVAPFPATTSPDNRVGTSFKAIKLTLEEFLDRGDDYPSNDITRSSDLHILPNPFKDGYVALQNRNLKTNPLPFSIVKQLNWQDYSVLSESNPKLVPSSFNYPTGYNLNACSLVGVDDREFPAPPSFDPGKNNFFVPNDLVLNYGGEIVRPDGYMYKTDLEIGTVVVEIPDVSLDGEKTINILTDLVADYSGSGITRLGYEAMRFADCSFVGMDALEKDQLRFSIAIQSFSPSDGYSASIVNKKIGSSMNYSTGLLTLNFTNLYLDPVFQTLNTKVQIEVYIKKAGWNNKQIFVNALKTKNLFGL